MTETIEEMERACGDDGMFHFRKSIPSLARGLEENKEIYGALTALIEKVFDDKIVF